MTETFECCKNDIVYKRSGDSRIGSAGGDSTYERYRRHAIISCYSGNSGFSGLYSKESERIKWAGGMIFLILLMM